MYYAQTGRHLASSLANFKIRHIDCDNLLPAHLSFFTPHFHDVAIKYRNMDAQPSSFFTQMFNFFHRKATAWKLADPQLLATVKPRLLPVFKDFVEDITAFELSINAMVQDE